MIIIFTIAGCLLGAMLGFAFGYVLRRMRQPQRMWTYLAAVAVSVIPYVLHYSASIAYLERSGVDSYQGFEQYVTYFPVTVLVLILVAFVMAWRKAAVAALLPVTLGAVYWYGLVPQLYRGMPAPEILLDNTPFIWLFESSLASFVILFTASSMALRSTEPFRPSPTGTR
jgi:NhaP-type Na+/H+ or K+/H+ antiporter